MKLGETKDIVLPVSVKIMALYPSQSPSIRIFLNVWLLEALHGLLWDLCSALRSNRPRISLNFLY